MVVMFEELNVEVKTVDEGAVEFEKSPLRILIAKYEKMKVENESTIKFGHIEADRSRAEPKCGTDVSGAKPKCANPSGRPVCVVPVKGGSKPVQAGAKPSQSVAKVKKKVWGKKKNGLFGWKMVVMDENKHQNIHTQNNTQSTSTQNLKSVSQQTNFKKWLVMPKQNVWGGGQPKVTLLKFRLRQLPPKSARTKF